MVVVKKALCLLEDYARRQGSVLISNAVSTGRVRTLMDLAPVAARLGGPMAPLGNARAGP